MLNSKPVITPMEGQISLTDTKGEKMDSTLYRQAIGSLMYLAVRHPSRYRICGKPTRSTCGKPNQTALDLGYTDSDWGGCTTSRKSTNGYVFLMSGGSVSWKSKKQSCVAQSSSDAEYIALATAVKEAI
eukprot:IDg3421t1